MRIRVMRWIALAVIPVSGLWAQDLTGIWQGTVRNPDTQQDLRTVVKIASSEGDPVKANFYSIDQTFLVFPATITFKGSSLKMNIPGIGAVYDAKLSPDGSTMTGTVKGFSVPAPWILKRVSEDQAWAIPKPPTPARPMAADADPSFDVATVKLSQPDAKQRGIRVQNVTFSALDFTLADLVTTMFDVDSKELFGLPAWATSERFDITGKPDKEGQPSQDQWKSMMRKLLASRFHFTFHTEQRELPVYALTVAKGGAKISKNDPKNETTGIIFRGPGSVLLNNVTIEDFRKMLQSAAVDRPVVDQTGLAGKYDFSLVWTPYNVQVPAPNPTALAPLDKAEPPPDIFTATQQQLGLKLEATRLRVEVMVVDKVEKPSDD